MPAATNASKAMVQAYVRLRVPERVDALLFRGRALDPSLALSEQGVGSGSVLRLRRARFEVRASPLLLPARARVEGRRAEPSWRGCASPRLGEADSGGQRRQKPREPKQKS